MLAEEQTWGDKLAGLGYPGRERGGGEHTNQQRLDRLQDSQQTRCWLPVLRLQQPDADIAKTVVGDVGMVDARREGHIGRLERVVGREGDDDAELAACIDGVGRAFECDVPFVQITFVGELDRNALGGVVGAIR